MQPEAGEVGGVEYWPIRKCESIIRVERSSAGPMSIVDLGAAKTSGVWSPRPREGSITLPKFCSAGGSWGTVRSGASGWPARRLRGLERSTVRACSGRSRNSTCLYVGGRLEVEDILTVVGL
jgi:hypothetical protein